MSRPMPFPHVCLFLLLICLGNSLSAQTVTISPLSPYVAVTKTVQFAAKINDVANNDVVWFSGGVIGGNSTSGTISTTGLYTAPSTLPGQNPVQVKAVSKANTSKSALTYVNILSAGPTITSVTPNPLSVGTIVITIKGSGFLPNATVMDTYGSSPAIQMSTLTVTGDTITATGYQGSAPSASFCVKNPGSDYSNSIVVPIGTPNNESKTLTVVNGTGSGKYSAGTIVNIAAVAPSAGQSFINWAGAVVANSNAASTTITMPSFNTTVTANFTSNGTYSLTVVNGTGSGNYLPGAVVNISANAPALGKQFLNWTGAAVANPNSSSTTYTMTAANATATANYFTPVAPIPFPVTTHPRLWVTVNDIPKLQGWASAANPIYTQGMVPVLNHALTVYNNSFFPGGVANPNYPDTGDVQGYSFFVTEQYGAIFAFNSLIDPSPANRIRYAQYARNLLMVAMNQAVLGHAVNMPFRDPMFAVYNRANGSGEQWPLIVDWIYSAKDGQGNDILTPSDKLTIRKVFMIWANDCLNASTTGGDHPSPIGAVNVPQLLPGGKPYRMASNNYYLGHARLLTMMALSIDPVDDPAINPNAPQAQLGNSLRSYLTNANGAWLYQTFAMMGDPQTVATAYGIPGNGNGLGLSSGGLPPEGMLYGHSYAYVLGQLLALQTAGFNNPAYSGPQIGLIGAPIWDRFVTGYMSSLTPTAQIAASQSWLGPIFQIASYGDLLRLWATPDSMQPFALLSLLEQQNGQNTHTSAARWFAVNAAEGGSGMLYNRISNPWSWSTTQSILYYMLLDPAAAPAVDPRPTFPPTFYDAPAGRLIGHSDWSPMGTMFDYRASWISINHQLGDGGMFELFRKGEWLTKEMSNYDNNALGMTTVYHNTLALQNWCANGKPNLQWFEAGEWTNGSQWMLGLNAGDPITVTSNGPGYTYISSDLTKLYNRPNFWTPGDAAIDVTQATRSLVWLNNDYVIVYDRGTTNHSGLFKRFNLSLVNNPVISGNTTIQTMASGQKLFVQTLLPTNASITSTFAAGGLNPIAQLEPTRFILTVEDPNKPANARFLHVLQGADPGAPIASATYLQSDLGTAFDGTVFGSTAIFFPVNVGAIAATTFTVPNSVHTLLVTGLAPNGAFSVSITPGGSTTVITITPSASGSTADSAGVLRITF